MLALLKEKRQAVITHAVTKGLDPNVKLRSTGVENLAKVPEGWQIIELRRIINRITSGSRGWAEYYADEGDIFLRMGNLTRDSIGINLTDIQHVKPPPGAEGERTRIQAGDLLFSITAYLGSVAVACEEVSGAYINQHIALVRPDNDKLYPRFAAYTALSDIGQRQLSGHGYGGTKIQLALDDVKSLRIPYPPIQKQSAIANHLDREIEKFDNLSSEIQTAITKLQEYRTALISAAVTGKIDVRGYAP